MSRNKRAKRDQIQILLIIDQLIILNQKIFNMKEMLQQRLTFARSIKIGEFPMMIEKLSKQHHNTNAQLLDREILRNAGKLASQVFDKKITLLEVGAGDGNSTSAFLSTFKQVKSYIGTDLHFNCQKPKILSDISSREAVKKFGAISDCLLIMYPPPNCSMDYAAISQFEKLQNTKYLIYIGQMGASDGCPGIYRYLFESEKWKLIFRKLLKKIPFIFYTNETEIFIFERKK